MPHTCRVCSFVYETRDTEEEWVPRCCLRCLAPRREVLESTPAAQEAWLLGLYAHPASIEDFGFLEHMLRARARDEANVQSVVDGLRNIDFHRLIDSVSARKDWLYGFDVLGLDQAIRELVAEYQAGILAWRLDQIERRAVTLLQAERQHHERILDDRHAR